jgi:hypothetical protein
MTLLAGDSLTTDCNLIYSPHWFSGYNLWLDMQETILPTVLLLLRDVTVETRRSHEPSPLLRNPIVHSCRQAVGNVCTSSLPSNVCSATQHGTAELGTAWRKRRFVYYCVIAVFTETLPINSPSKFVTIPLHSIRGGEFLNCLNDYQFPKEDSAP